MGLSFRPCQSGDLSEIFEINKQVQLNPWSMADLLSELRAPNGVSIIGIKEDGKIAGYLFSRVALDVWELLSIGVAISSQSLSLGSKLLNLLIEKVSEGGGEVLLEVNHTNQKAMNFYIKNGFQEVNRRAKYYQNGDDCIVMKLCVAKRH